MSGDIAGSSDYNILGYCTGNFVMSNRKHDQAHADQRIAMSLSRSLELELLVTLKFNSHIRLKAG